MAVLARLELEWLDAGAELADFLAGRDADGAVVSFTGLARARGADGKLHVALVNLDPDNAMAVELALQGWKGTRVAGQLLTAPAMDTHNTFDAPDTLQPTAFDAASVANGRLTLTLPAKSLVVLSLD